MHLFTHVSAASLFFGASVGFIGSGGPCFATNNRLDPASFKFISECSDQTYCSAAKNGTCRPRLCRRDEFPFGFDADQPLPPLCPSGTFCPDEGSGCKPLSPAGAPCQLNRDEQCAPPPDWRDLANSHNFNGSICLHSMCRHTNASLGQACVRENTAYIDFSPGGERYNYTIARDNCRSLGYFCNESQMLCDRTKPIGSACTSDVECSTHNCGSASTCVESLGATLRVSAWQCVVTAVIIFLGMIATCVVLTLLHKRHRRQQEKELRAYYVDQLSLRRAIIELHIAATEKYAEKDGCR